MDRAVQEACAAHRSCGNFDDGPPWQPLEGEQRARLFDARRDLIALSTLIRPPHNSIANAVRHSLPAFHEARAPMAELAQQWQERVLLVPDSEERYLTRLEAPLSAAIRTYLWFVAVHTLNPPAGDES